MKEDSVQKVTLDKNAKISKKNVNTRVKIMSLSVTETIANTTNGMYISGRSNRSASGLKEIITKNKM